MSLHCSIDFYLISWVSVIGEFFQYSNSPAAGWLSYAGQSGVPVRRGFMTQSADRSPPAAYKRPSVHWGCWAFQPPSLWFSWSLPRCRSKPSCPRMDLPGSHLQELQPDLRCVANQTEDTLTLEQSAACEYEIRCHKMLFVLRMQCLKWTLFHTFWLYRCRASLFWKSQSEVNNVRVIRDPYQIRLITHCLPILWWVMNGVTVDGWRKTNWTQPK